MSAALIDHNFPVAMPAACERVAYVRVRNQGSKTWSAGTGNQPVLNLRINRKLCAGATPLADEVPPGEMALFTFRWQSPALRPAARLSLELEGGEARANHTTMHRQSLSLQRRLTTQTQRLWSAARERNPWFYLPSGGIEWSCNGPGYPLFVREASGPRFRDAEGREFIDFVCGWGACFLGHADPRITAAVTASLGRTALTMLPNVTEVNLSEALCRRFPGAEMVLFGKHGSDVCTAAVRLARAFTQRPVILFSGYHGWHDWNRMSSSQTPKLHGLPTEAYAFAHGNLSQLHALFRHHAGQVAAVMLEPAGQIEGVDGPVTTADPKFLKTLQSLCRLEGALLIFDEIFTGFRYLGGSVQEYTGVRPDLSCFGKALGAGLPISALVGRADVFKAGMGSINYDPTFKGEPHAMAAALEALAIYDTEGSAAKAWQFGKRLFAGIDELLRERRIHARTVGLPIRATVRFDEQRADPAALRTFLQQCLLKRGIVTFRGFMMPSAAHTKVELETTLRCYAESLDQLAGALESGTLYQQLEIPLIL